MKSKIGLLAVVLVSGLALSACTNKSATNTNSTGTETQTQQEQSEENGANPSGTADKKGPGQQIDLAAAAKTLGVTEDALKAALGVTDKTKEASTTPGAKPSGQPKQMDLAAAAKTLGVTEDALKAALGLNNMPSGVPQGREKPEGSESAPANQE